MNLGFTSFSDFNWIMMFVFWVLIILALVAIIRGGFGAHAKESSALDILKERYARGEIDKLEFDQKKNDLMKKSPK